MLIPVDIDPRRRSRAAQLVAAVLVLRQRPERPARGEPEQREVHVSVGAREIDDPPGIGHGFLAGPPHARLWTSAARELGALHAQVGPFPPVEKSHRLGGQLVGIADHQEREDRHLGIDHDVGVESERIEHGFHRARLHHVVAADGTQHTARRQADGFVSLVVAAADRVTLVGLEADLGVGHLDHERVGAGWGPRLGRLSAGEARDEGQTGRQSGGREGGERAAHELGAGARCREFHRAVVQSSGPGQGSSSRLHAARMPHKPRR